MKNITKNSPSILTYAFGLFLLSFDVSLAKDTKLQNSIVSNSSPFFTIHKIIDFHEAGVKGEWKIGKLTIPGRKPMPKVPHKDGSKSVSINPVLQTPNRNFEIAYRTPIEGDEWISNGKFFRDCDGTILNPLNRVAGRSTVPLDGVELSVIYTEYEGSVDYKSVLVIPDGMNITEEIIAEILKHHNGLQKLTTNLNSCLSNNIEVSIPGWIGITLDEEIAEKLLTALWLKTDPKVRPFVVAQCVSYSSKIKEEVLCKFFAEIAQHSNQSELELLLKPLIAVYFCGWPIVEGSNNRPDDAYERRLIKCIQSICKNTKLDSEVIKYAKNKFIDHE